MPGRRSQLSTVNDPAEQTGDSTPSRSSVAHYIGIVVDAVAAAPEGDRIDKLIHEATGTLHEAIGTGRLKHPQAEQVLDEAAARVGVDPGLVRATRDKASTARFVALLESCETGDAS